MKFARRTARNAGIAFALVAELLSASDLGATAEQTARATSYGGEVYAAIAARTRSFPCQAKQAGAVGVAGAIGREGQISEVSATTSSNDASLDRLAEQMVRTARFPPPPGGSFRFHMTICFSCAVPKPAKAAHPGAQ